MHVGSFRKAGHAPEMERVQYENRLARLEVGMEHMDSNISEIKVQLHDLRTSMDARFEVVNQKFEAVNQRFDAISDRFADTNGKIESAVQRLEDKMDRKFTQYDQKPAAFTGSDHPGAAASANLVTP